jgi:hypothetical protein
LIGVAIAKCMTRINPSGLARLQEAVAFEFQDTIDEIQVETMQIRRWVFWQTIISAIEVRNFRRMMLTGMPPALRRRVITSLDPKGLRSMLADTRRPTGRALIANGVSRFLVDGRPEDLFWPPRWKFRCLMLPRGCRLRSFRL